MSRLIDRFIKYIKIDTQSDPNSGMHPSTQKQFNLAYLLRDELISLGLEAFTDKLGYTYAHILANTENTHVKPIGFIAHVDTSPDAPGANVNPRIIKNYDGKTIFLNDTLSMHPDHFNDLNHVIGDDLIVTDGHTLLGADDKLGVAQIMEAVTFLVENPSFKHGDIYICFTPDEEIGEGADYFNHDFFKADFAYTMDGSHVGGIEYENFNAASAHLAFVGKSIHPGSAKLKMVNALHIAHEFHSMLPVFLNPAFTEKYEGFNHLSNFEGSVEMANASYIIRNHDKNLFQKQKNDFENIKIYLNQKYGYEAIQLNIKDSYYNMYEVIKDRMDIIDLATKATQNAGVKPIISAIRGGTDGARLSFDGLPCPNLGTGGFQFHGRFEFASINQAQKAYEIILEIIKLHTNA